VELVRHGSGAGHLAAAALENLAQLRLRAVAVVRHHVYQDGDAAGAVALVGDFLDDLAAQLAGAALDGPLDVVLGHADLPRLVDGVAQLQVHGRVAAAAPGCDDDRPAQLAPQLAALGVNRPFLVLDRRPVGMPGHGSSFTVARGFAGCDSRTRCGARL